jgi:hypothetical protein
MGHAPLDLNPGSGHLAELKGIVGLGKNGSGQILAHLVLINIKGSHEIDIADMIAAKIDMHKSGHKLILFGFTIVVDALNQGRGTIAHTDYGHIYLTQGLTDLLSNKAQT